MGGSDVEAAASTALGLALPGLLASGTGGGGVVALRFGPDAWLLLVDAAGADGVAARLRGALAGLPHAVVEVSERFAAVAVAGRRSREVLNAGCALDLHPGAFPPGRVARTLLGKAAVILARPDAGDRFELLVDGSLASYLWRFLENVALEHGARAPDA